jgi:nucleotide-binding universal stress UspA family protein
MMLRVSAGRRAATMSRIIYATDFSPASRAAFATAVRMARRDRAELLIVHVLGPVVPIADGYLPPSTYAEMDTAARRHANKQLDALVRRARKANVRTRGLLVEGVAHDAIVRAARTRGADMIVLGTHGRTGFARFVLGSVAGRVVSHAACPVLTVRGKG